jgi:hypothetical protein
VGEIREKAAGPLRDRERKAARLNAVAKLIAEGADIPPAEPEMRTRGFGSTAVEEFDESKRCTPEDAAAILEEFGLSSGMAKSLKRHLGSPRRPTRADYIAMGVDPAILDRKRPSDSESLPC